MNLRPCRIRMVNDGDDHFDEMDEYHRDGRYYYRDDVDQEIKHLIELQRGALAEAEHWRDNHLAVLEKIKVALAMPGTGNYVDFARECRAAWGAANPTTEGREP